MSVPPPLQRLHRLAVVLLFPLLLAFGCAPGEFAAGAKTANVIANGVACGVAAANGTPCTPQVLLDRLAALDREQKETVAPAVQQASAIDPKLTETLIEQLKKNSDSNRQLVEAIFDLAQRQPAPIVTVPPPSSEPPPTATAPPSSPPAMSASPPPAPSPTVTSSASASPPNASP